MAVLASDSFDRANDSTGLGSNWANNFTEQHFTINGNKAVPSDASAFDSSNTYSAITWPNDQYSKAKLTTNGSGVASGLGLQVRQSGSTAVTDSTYFCYVNHSNVVYLAKWVSGTYSDLTNAATTFVDGDTWEIRAVGTTISAWRNGSLVVSTTDSSVSSGRPGLYFAADGSTSSVDDWEGGDFSAGSTSITPNAIATAESVFAPTVKVTVLPNTITTAVALFAPIVTLSGGSQTVQAGTITTAVSVPSPSIVIPQTISPLPVVISPQVFAPVIGSLPSFATNAAFNRYLVDQYGAAYFIQGCSPQAMASILTLPQMQSYFIDQAGRGMNSAQIHLMINQVADFPDAHPGAANAYGDSPFTNLSTLSGPVEAYWTVVDSMLTMAAQYGFTVWASPAEYISWKGTIAGLTDAQAIAFGQFIGNRYKNRPNIIWSFGNDWQDYPNAAAQSVKILEGIRSTGDIHLVTNWMFYYDSTSWDATSGPTPSVAMAYTDWPTYVPVERAYTHAGGTAPVFYGEGWYDRATGAATPVWATNTPETIRREAWWALTWGACGHFFGQWRVALFGSGWETDLDSVAAQQIARIKTLVPTLSGWQNLVPDFSHALITAGSGSKTTSADRNILNESLVLNDTFATAAVTPDKHLALVYVPSIRTWTLNTGILAGTVSGYWFDPTSGVTTAASAPWAIPTAAHLDGSHDWVLVLQATPALPQTVLPNAIVTAEVIYQPTVTMGAVAGQIGPNLIPSAEQVYAPAVLLQVLPGTITTAAAIYTPLVVVVTPQTVQPGTITTASAVYSTFFVGFVIPSIRPDTIASAAAVYTPSVRVLPRPATPALHPVVDSRPPPLRPGL